MEQQLWLLVSVILFQLSLPCLHCKYRWPKEMLVQLTLYLEKVKLGRKKNHKSLVSNIKCQVQFPTLTWMCQTYKIKIPIFPHLLSHRTQKALCLISVPKTSSKCHEHASHHVCCPNTTSLVGPTELPTRFLWP